MSGYGKHPRIGRTTEPIDTAVWHWFVCNGPHGERFRWPHEFGRLRDIELLAEFINEKEDVHVGFIEKARVIAREALDNDDPVLVQTGIQVITVVGTDEDMSLVQKLLKHPNEQVVVNARCALFERGVKIKKNEI
jgi:hypothetical protein